jgi:hypothetical protein
VTRVPHPHLRRTARVTAVRQRPIALIAVLTCLWLPLGACAKEGDPPAVSTTATDTTPTTNAPEDDNAADDEAEDDEVGDANQDPTDRDADQAIADQAVLREGDLPDWTAAPPEDEEEDEASPAECEALEEEFGADFYVLLDSDVSGSPAARSPEFAFENSTRFRILRNSVVVEPDDANARLFFEVLRSNGAQACIEAKFVEGEDEDAEESFSLNNLEITEVDQGDEAALLTGTLSGDDGAGPFDMGFAMVVVRVDRAATMFLHVGADVDVEGTTLEAPSIEVLTAELEQTGVVDLVVSRLEDALA